MHAALLAQRGRFGQSAPTSLGPPDDRHVGPRAVPIAHKLAATPLEYPALLERWPEFETEAVLDRYLAERGQKITVWSAADVGADYNRVGLSGSPTKVLKVDFVVLGSSDSKEFKASQEGISELMRELVQEYVL